MYIVIKEHPHIYRPSPLDRFLDIPPDAPRGFEQAKANLVGREFPRAALSSILADYNAAVGNDSLAMANISKLADEGSFVVITGQPVGLAAGPAYTVLKAISAVKLARDLGAIPVFWASTEEHDVAEIDHTYHIDDAGNLHQLAVELPRGGHMVEDIELNPRLCAEVVDAFQELGISPSIWPILKGGVLYSDVMIRLLVKLFAGTGLVFVEPRLLRNLAIPFFKQELAQHESIFEALNQTTRRLEDAGGSPQFELQADTNLFFKSNSGRRMRVTAEGGAYSVGIYHYTNDQFMDLVERMPERFSCNLIARLVLQTTLFPTAACVVGPTEIAHFRQLSEYHKIHGTHMPWIVPRMSATFISQKASEMLRQCNLEPWERIPHHWQRIMPALDGEISQMIDSWEEVALRCFSKDIEEQVISKEIISRQLRSMARRLKTRVCKARLKQTGTPYHALHLLKNLLHPHGVLQERMMNWWGFQAKTEENLVQELISKLDWRERGHHYCFLE